MSWRSSILIVILVFAILFSMLYLSTLSNFKQQTVPTPRITQIQAIEIVEGDLKAHGSEPITTIIAYEGGFNFEEGTYIPISKFKERAGSDVNLRLVYSDPDDFHSPTLFYYDGNRRSFFIDCSESDALVCIVSCFSKGELFWIVDIFSEYYAVDAISGEVLFSQSRQNQLMEENAEVERCFKLAS